MLDSQGSPIHWLERRPGEEQPRKRIGHVGVIGGGQTGSAVVRLLHDVHSQELRIANGGRYGHELVHPLISGIYTEARRRFLSLEPLSKKDWPRGSNRAGPTKRERNRHNRRKHKRSRQSGR